MVLALFFWITALCWLLVVVASTVGIMRMPNLPPFDDSVEQGVAKVSVIIPARNEASNIEETVRRLLVQQDADLEIIVVNDRSTDETGAVLDRSSQDDQRVRAVHIESLPQGWVGKCHALHVAAAQARGEWILFIDADIRMTPQVIARALQAAGREAADHICLMPGQRESTALGKASLLMLMLGMPDAFTKANRDRLGCGFGAFNLVRAEALREIGGHEALRMEIVDDHQLGRLLYHAGKRTRGYFAGRDVEMDFARTPAGVVRAIEKNAFAMLRYSVPFVATLAIVLGALLTGAAAGPFAGNLAGIAAGASFLSLAVPGSLLARRYDWPAHAGVLAPVGLLVILFAGGNSVIKTLARGGVRWRGDFHRLADLRKGMVRGILH
ncbi:MAG: glycosyltransferase [Chloroflexi bacterium]|nr:glycosyltransferase [Chloroflexota bacterium]MCZ6651844.1 glycosyltransferase [Planctomycetota bacterium]